MTRSAVQVVAFVGGEAQRTRDRTEYLRARLRPALLFESCVVVGRHERQLRDLFAAQPRRASARSCGKPDVAGLQVLPVSAEELGEGFTIHVSMMRAGR
jgi:hypothetical protein